MTTLSILALVLCAMPLAYWFILALASIRPPASPALSGNRAAFRFAIAIAAYDEASVIRATVQRLLDLEYPAELFRIHVVADHCSDQTAKLAREAGATVHERNKGPRTGKGAALSWLFERILNDDCDAVVVFDSDTRVSADFLRVMSARLAQGDRVVQGQHAISNPGHGWFPALTWAMFMIDNRFQNLGRTNLGWSAKNMGDSICFRADVLRKTGWGAGLTEDFQLRQRLLLERITIAYEPAAIGYGEAPATWSQALKQRARWLRGTSDASQQLGRRLLIEAIERRSGALLDGALQAYLPSYSTLTLLFVTVFAGQLLVNWVFEPAFSSIVVGAWAAGAASLMVYPLIGLALERAPLKAYLVILTGPVFILWRTWLALWSRAEGRQITWIRTAHGGRS